MVKNCAVCQAVRKAPPSAPLYPWRWPARVWQRVHIDFPEKDGNYFLGLIDSHSKWIEVAHMRSTTAQSTIDQMRLWFAAYSFYVQKLWLIEVQKVLLMPPAVLNKTPCGSDFPAHKRKVIYSSPSANLIRFFKRTPAS